MKKYIVIIGAVLAVVIGIIIVASQDNDVVAPVAKNGDYIAMGDSVAAGVGLKDYSDSSACDRTQQSYPNTVSQRLNYSLMSIACGEATTSAGLLASQEVNKLAVSPQVDALKSDKKPKLISITIGANDAQWTSYIQKCYTQVCGSEADTTEVNEKLVIATANLETVLQKVAKLYPNETPKVVVTGYYKLFAPQPQANCAELTGLDATEVQWIGQLQDTVNGSLQAVAQKYAFASYAAIDFTGHELCSGDSWIQGIGASKPYHPTEAGQKAMADAVVTAVNQNRGTQ